ncbi:MAG: hypothetical protein CM1200mP9_04880 [Gammaproteobacteria bacterium]|nr:MAG: hypothetical protein CM1200mP9_04880 [Gammaproteobacteria bacterium]
MSGFGTTGPWKDRPLFGPGAEAMSGQNSMMGEPGSSTPGRPGTTTYADHVCGLYLLVAVLGALNDRAERPGPRHVDVSLYETGVAHIGTVVAERSIWGRVDPPQLRAWKSMPPSSGRCSRYRTLAQGLFCHRGDTSDVRSGLGWWSRLTVDRVALLESTTKKF